MECVLLKMEEKALCMYCAKETSKQNLKRHETSCLMNSQALQHFKCDHCHKLYKRSYALKAHLKKCSDSQENLGRSKSSIPCSYEECNGNFNTLSSLVGHLQLVHNAHVYNSQTLTFENETRFIDWKDEEQARTYSYFAKNYGDRYSNEGKNKYFYCQQHGSEKAHTKKEEANRKTDRRVARGRVKTGKVCISSMKATYLKDGSVKVVYQPNHSHPLSPSSVQFHPLSSESYKFIDTQLAAGVSPLVIQRELKNRALEKANRLKLEKENYRESFVSLKLIKERARRIRNSTMYHMDDDAKSVMLLTPHLEIIVSDNKQTFFSEPVLDLTADEETVKSKGDREIYKNRLTENINKILLLVENENVPDNILSKLDADVDTAVKRCEALLEDEGGIRMMAASVSHTSSKKLKTQMSQMLSFKAPKKRRNPFDAVSAAAKKKSVSAEIIVL